MINIINITRTIDKYIIGYLLITIAFILKPIKLLFKKKNNKRIAIIRIWTLGDTINCLPMLKKLKDKGYKIDVYTSSRASPVIELSGLTDKIINFPEFILKPFYYDYVIDNEPYLNFTSLISFYMSKKSIGFSNLYRNILYNYKFEWDKNKHVSENFAKLLKPLKLDFKPTKLIPLQYSKKDKLVVDKIISKYKNKKLVAIHLGMAETAKYRMWKLENFKELIKKLIDNNIFIVLTGSKKEVTLNQKLIKEFNSNKIINFAGTKLSEFAYLLTKVNVFVGNDTGPMHLSAAMSCKTIGLFGPNLPKRYGPLGKDCVTIYKANNMKCSPCILPFEGKFKKCPYNGKCMDLIKVDNIYNEVMRLLE